MQLASHHDKQNNFRFVFRLPCVPRYKLIKEVIIVKLKTKDALKEKIMNKTILSGRLVKDVELSYLPKVGTPKINFTLAVERSYQKDYKNKVVDYIPVEFVGKRAEKIATLIAKVTEFLFKESYT